MISIFTVKDETVLKQISEFTKKDLKRLGMYDDFSQEQREKLYRLSKKRINGSNDLIIIFSIFNGSTLQSAIKRLKGYKFSY